MEFAKGVSLLAGCFFPSKIPIHVIVGLFQFELKCPMYFRGCLLATVLLILFDLPPKSVISTPPYIVVLVFEVCVCSFIVSD